MQPLSVNTGAFFDQYLVPLNPCDFLAIFLGRNRSKFIVFDLTNFEGRFFRN